MLRDMLGAGVFDCLNGEFGDIQVSVLYCVLLLKAGTDREQRTAAVVKEFLIRDLDIGT